MRKILYILAAIILLASCSGNKEKKIPEGIIGDSLMVEVMYDYYQVEAIIVQRQIQHNYKRSESFIYNDFLYEKHGIDRATFKRSLNYYGNHNREKMDEILQEVIARLSKLEIETRDKGVVVDSAED